MDVQLEITGFAGMNNFEDAKRLKGPTVSSKSMTAECASIINADIDDTMAAILRQGVTLQHATTTAHSLDPSGSGYYVDGTFNIINPDYSITPLYYLQNSVNKMSYTKVNYLTVCSNGVDLFMAQGPAIMQFTTPTALNKGPIKPATIVRHYQRRLWYAIGPMLFYSDPDNIEQRDTREKPFVFKAPIDMILPLDNGIYVGADKIYWLAGREPRQMSIPGVAYDMPAVAGTDRIFDGSLIKTGGKWGAFVATDGVCLCSDGGQITNVTMRKLLFSNGKYGSALIKKDAGVNGNINQYITWV